MTKCRPKLWAIIGESGVGKSPTVKALVSQQNGGRTSKVSPVLLRGGGYIDVHCKVMALQEAGWTPADTVAEVDKWIRSVAKQHPPIEPACINLLFAIRFDPVPWTKGKRTWICPAAEDYLSHFVRAGWDLKRLVLMSPEDSRSHLSRFGVPTLWANNSTAPNETNGAVRNHFGWA